MHSSDSAATGRSLAGVARGACRALAAQASAMTRCIVIVAQWLNAMYANFLGLGQWPAMKEIARWLWLGIFEPRGEFYDGTCMTQTSYLARNILADFDFCLCRAWAARASHRAAARCQLRI